MQVNTFWPIGLTKNVSDFWEFFLEEGVLTFSSFLSLSHWLEFSTTQKAGPWAASMRTRKQKPGAESDGKTNQFLNPWVFHEAVYTLDYLPLDWLFPKEKWIQSCFGCYCIWSFDLTDKSDLNFFFKKTRNLGKQFKKINNTKIVAKYYLPMTLLRSQGKGFWEIWRNRLLFYHFSLNYFLDMPVRNSFTAHIRLFLSFKREKKKKNQHFMIGVSRHLNLTVTLNFIYSDLFCILLYIFSSLIIFHLRSY